jgi:three-Cys-motif partner protein
MVVKGQTTIFEELGIEPMKAERPKLLPAKPRRTVDGIELVPIPGYVGLLADPDGLAVRLVHSHSRKKSKKVGFYAEIVAGSMTGKWPSLWWVELHAGPGKLYELETQELLDGSPLDALHTSKRYNGYVFVEFDPLCAAALRERTKGMPNVYVIEGDCNIADVHDQIRALVPTNALVVMYADPEDLDDLDFQTVRFFSARYPHLDWLINFPVSGAVRYLTAGGEDRAAKLLDHPNPAELLAQCTGRTYGPSLSMYFQRLLEALGHTCRYETIYLDVKNVPFYDLFLATKDKTGLAVDFFDKACGIKASGQRTLDLSAS